MTVMMLWRHIARERASVLAMCLAAALLLGASADATSHAGESDYAARIGVFNDCFSIRNAALEPGTPVTIIRFNSEDENTVSGDTRERRIAARILAKAELVDDCPIWVEDWSLREDSAEFTLYTISPESPGMLNSVELGIGVLSIPPGDETPLDIDGNGVVDTFPNLEASHRSPSKFGEVRSGSASRYGATLGDTTMGRSSRIGPNVGAVVLLLGVVAPATSDADKATYDSRIGVFYDDCLSIGSSALEPGTPVTIIRFNSQEDERFASGDTPERRVAARVVAKADLVDDCPSWIEDRSLRENSAELFLYALSSEIPGLLDSVEWGIGIVGISPGDEIAHRSRWQWDRGHLLQIRHFPRARF